MQSRKKKSLLLDDRAQKMRRALLTIVIAFVTRQGYASWKLLSAKSYAHKTVYLNMRGSLISKSLLFNMLEN